MGQLWNRPIRTAIVAAAVTLLGGCEATLKETLTFHLADYISSVSTVDGSVQGTFVEGAPPEVGSGPNASVSGIGVMINGGTSQQGLSGDAAFTRVIVAGQNMEGYYQVDLPAGVSAQDILLGGSTNAVAAKVVIQYAVGAGADIGAYASQDIRFLRVGNGDIQISVAWSDTSDVDLYVIDPSGEQISYSNKTSASGGTLDLDGNAACNRTSLPGGGIGFASNENVVWPVGKAIAGQYKVVIDYYSACGNPSTDYVVTIQRTGASPAIYTGTFVGTGAPSDSVATFTY